MNKVICDVCGTEYPETAIQCPICGCVRSGDTAAASGTDSGEKGYTYVKGGRFSKANVKKRLKASQAQQAAAAELSRRIQEPEEQDDDGYDDDENAELGVASNKGLIVVVILLLLAIIAVSSYIAIHFFGGRKDRNNNYSRPSISATSDPTQGTEPSGTTPNPDRIACTDLKLNDTVIELGGLDEIWELYFEVSPANTTDAVSFHSSNPNVAVVDANGCVSAVGNGEAIITVRCGVFEKECAVICRLEDAGTEPTNPSEPEPTDPVGPVEEVKLNRDDITLSKKGETWKLYNGNIALDDITWTSDNEAVVTFKDGVVEAVGKGRTKVHAKYQGQDVFCWVSVTIAEEPEQTEPSVTEPVDPTEPTETEPTEPSTEPVVELVLNRDDFMLFAVGESWQLYDGIIDRSQINWSSDDTSVVTVSDGLVTAVANGRTQIRASYNGQEVTCWVSVQISE